MTTRTLSTLSTSPLPTFRSVQNSHKKRRATRLSPQRIAAIAQAVSKGEISLPDLELPTNKDYVSVWALVDPGSAVHVVDAPRVFPGASVEPPAEGTQRILWRRKRTHST